jgi:sortase A
MKFRKWSMFRFVRTQTLLHWSRYPFLIIGILALGYCGYVLLDAKIYQAYETWRFEQALKNPGTSEGSRERVHPSLLSRPPLKLRRAEVKSPVSASREASVLGRMEIGSIGLAVIVLEGTGSGTLRRAVGHVRGTALPGEQGNMAIAGHRDTFFRPLRNIRKDDEITLTTLSGAYRYRVESIKVVGPWDTDVLDDSGGSILTLVTCYPFYFVGPAPKRFIVRARQIPG